MTLQLCFARYSDASAQVKKLKLQVKELKLFNKVYRVPLQGDNRTLADLRKELQSECCALPTGTQNQTKEKEMFVVYSFQTL